MVVDLNQLLNFGALGIIVGLFVAGLVSPKPTVDRLIEEASQAREQRDEVIRDVLTEVSPALQGAIKAMERRQTLDDEILDVLVDIRRMLEAPR